TGTLTRNEMTVRSVATGAHLFEVSGIGYEPRGGFSLDGLEILPEHRPLLLALARAAALCNESALHGTAGHWIVEGDPMEGALLTAAIKAGLDPAFESQSFPRTDLIPFDADHRFMATLHHSHTGDGFIYLKGAPERVIEMCAFQRGGD